MKNLIESLDLILDTLREGDNALAGVLLLLLKAKLIARKEDVKVSREIGMKKKQLINSIKKLKL